MNSIDTPEIQVISPGVIVFPGNTEISSPAEWQDYLDDLSVMSADGTPYAPIPFVFEKSRSSEKPRPNWAGDHFWHLDLSSEGGQIGKLVTAIYYAEGDESTPGTDIVDTVGLRHAMQRDGVFDREELDETILSRLQAEFSNSTYYTHTLPLETRSARRKDRKAILKYLESREIDGKEVSLQQYADHLDEVYPVSSLPLIQKNPFDTQRGDALMFDVERGRDIIDPDTGTSYSGLLYAMRLYLNLKEPELRERGVITTVSPEPGKVLLFSREGTLHRAQAGNDTNRKIYIGWLATSPECFNSVSRD